MLDEIENLIMGDTVQSRARELINKDCVIFLTNGIKLKGIIYELLDDGVVLVRYGNSQLIYMHAIATMSRDTHPEGNQT